MYLEVDCASDCQNELVELERKKDLFERAFNRQLLVGIPKKKAKIA
jgi:hypothetical protein